MLAIVAALAIMAMPQPTVAIPMDIPCSQILLDMGYRGMASDGIEAVYAPRMVAEIVCD